MRKEDAGMAYLSVNPSFAENWFKRLIPHGRSNLRKSNLADFFETWLPESLTSDFQSLKESARFVFGGSVVHVELVKSCCLNIL